MADNCSKDNIALRRDRLLDRNKNKTPASKTPTPATSTPTNTKSSTTSQPTIQEIYTQLQNLVKEMHEIKMSINFMSNKYDDLIQIHNTTVNENKKLKAELSNITHEHQHLQKQVGEINEIINTSKQNDLKNNIIIFGPPPFNNNLEVEESFEKILNKLHIQNNEINIENIYQLKNNNNNNKPPPLVVHCRDAHSKEKIMQMRKVNDLYTTDIGFKTKHKIIITDQLTAHNQQILNEAKQLRTHNYKFIWYKNGKILVKKNTNAPTIIIKSVEQVQHLKTDNVTL